MNIRRSHISRLAVCCALGSALLATPGFAQDVTDRAGSDVRIGGTAPGVCRIEAPTTTTAQGTTFVPSATSGGQVSISQMVNPVTGIAQSSSISLQFNTVCTVAHAVALRSSNGGLTRDEGRNVGNFASLVDYSVDARWAGLRATRTFNGTPSQVSMLVEDGAAGILELDVQVQAGSQPLATGRYSDALVVELTATS